MTAAAPAAGRSGAQAWAGFAASFEGSFDAYSDRVTRRMQELPTYEFVPEAELRGIVREGLGGLVPLIAERRAPNLTERRLYRHTTEAQASQGVTLDEMMQAWHMGFDVLRTWASEHVESEGLTGDVLLDFLDVTIPWLDSGVSVSVDYYRLAAQRSAQLDAEARTGFVRRVLTGDVGGEELRVRARMYGLNPAPHLLRAPCRRADAARTRPRGGDRWRGVGLRASVAGRRLRRGRVRARAAGRAGTRVPARHPRTRLGDGARLHAAVRTSPRSASTRPCSLTMTSATG